MYSVRAYILEINIQLVGDGNVARTVRHCWLRKEILSFGVFDK